MSNKQGDNSLPLQIADNFQKMATVSMEAMQPILKNLTENMGTLNKSMADNGIPVLNIFGSGKKSKCCPPEETCSPHCIASINRQAMAGERIMEAIMVTNNCGTEKTYRVGVRELKNLDGTLAPSQPFLDKATITLAPGRSERILMTLDLANFNNGSTYEAEIVLREKEINQNVCFTLHVNDNDPTEVSPHNEKKYKLKWQDWQSHFYCEPPRKRAIAPIRPLNPS